MRFSLFFRTLVWVACLVFGVALTLVATDAVREFLKSPTPDGTSSVARFWTLDDIFLYLGKAGSIVAGVMTAARLWLYAERHLPERIQERIRQWDEQSSTDRRLLLIDIEERWRAFPLVNSTTSKNTRERSTILEKRYRFLNSEDAKNHTPTRMVGLKISEIKAALSQMSFEKASYHFVKGCEYVRLADEGIGQEARKRALEEMANAAICDSDVALDRRDFRIHRACFEQLKVHGSLDEAMKALIDWREIAQAQNLSRELGECCCEIGALQIRKADDPSKFQYQSNAILVEAQAALQQALELLTANSLSRDVSRAKSHELLADVIARRGQIQGVRLNYERALKAYREVGDSEAVRRVREKIEQLGVSLENDETISSPQARIAYAQKSIGEVLFQQGRLVDCQAQLLTALRNAEQLATPVDISSDEREDLIRDIKAVLGQSGASSLRFPTPTL
jgi:tetratricopeptide (TPR) repeat protein